MQRVSKEEKRLKRGGKGKVVVVVTKKPFQR